LMIGGAYLVVQDQFCLRLLFSFVKESFNLFACLFQEVTIVFSHSGLLQI
jgi:hypothetical protein